MLNNIIFDDEGDDVYYADLPNTIFISTSGVNHYYLNDEGCNNVVIRQSNSASRDIIHNFDTSCDKLDIAFYHSYFMLNLTNLQFIPKDNGTLIIFPSGQQVELVDIDPSRVKIEIFKMHRDGSYDDSPYPEVDGKYVFGDRGKEFLRGTDYSDVIIPYEGNDEMWSGKGEDVFVFNGVSGDHKIIHDFDINEDYISFQNHHLVRYSDISVRDDGHGNTIISTKEFGEYLLLNVHSNELTADNYLGVYY